MIKLVENNKEALLVLENLSVDTAPLLASKMFTEGFGVNQDFLQFYAAFNDKGKLCAAFIKCNDRVFCLIETLYDKDEILLFLRGFQDFKIFISNAYANIIDRVDYYTCSLMVKKHKSQAIPNSISEIESKQFTDIIMNGKDKEYSIRFFLNNSHLARHGYLKNYAYSKGHEIVSIASVYSNNNFSYLCNVFTPEVFRHKGYASDLIGKITNNSEFHLICSKDVSPLYVKCGFTAYSEWIEFLY